MRVGFFLAIALAVGGCDAFLPPNLSAADPGPAGINLAIDRYVAAANEQDAAAVAETIGLPRPTTDIPRRLAAHGGRDLHDVRVSVSSEFPRIYHVTVDAVTGTSESISWREVVEWTGTDWHFAVLGE